MKLKKISILLFILMALPLCGFAQTVSLIPLPQKVSMGNGTFEFGKVLTTYADSYAGDSIAQVLARFSTRFAATTGITAKAAKESKAALRLKVNKSLGAEAYNLNVTSQKISIEASRPAGFFYALQTLQQLLPSRAVAAGAKAAAATRWAVPAVSISDAPRFGWRGFMLDEGRHIFGKEAVKKVLDVMAAYKMNRFHWHLTEDQGWRIEIKKYPRLTEVGAWRESKVLGWGDVSTDGEHYGGFYTQEDAREIVKYAAERFIQIVPEIDIPGHSQAAVAAYPELLACDRDNPHEVWLSQGVSADVMNVSNPQTVQFAKDVIDELADVFPFEYLHLGGDECPTQKWEASWECRRELNAIGSTKFRDLQTNFYRQLQNHINGKPADKRRHLIFWNEVLHGNTSAIGDDITVMAWVGADAAARDAATRGYHTILSPQIPYYINRRQSTLPTEPRSQGHGTETVEAVYMYEPMKDIAPELQNKYLGVQANFWSEWVEDAPTLQYLMLPRLAAVAEAGWTEQAQRSYPDFLKRLQKETEFYRLSGVNYGKHVFSEQW